MHPQLTDSTTIDLEDPVSELVEWFNVSGDMDDFIYFGEEMASSER